MAEELTDEEVFGIPELSDEDVFGNLDPSAIPIPTDYQIQTSPENLARYAAAGGGGGFVTNPRLTSREQLKGIAGAGAVGASFVAPELLIAAAPGLAPSAAAGTLGWLGRLGLAGAASGGAYETVQKAPEIALGETTPLQAAKDIGTTTLLAAPLGMVGGALGQKLLQTGAGAIGNVLSRQNTSLSDLVSNLRHGASQGFVRPLFETPSKASTRAAAELIESTTGERPAQSVGEAIGGRIGGGTYAELEHQLGSQAAGAIPPDARNAITRRILFSAAQLRGQGSTAEDIAQRTIDSLREEVNQNISGPVQDAIRTVSKELDESLKKSLSGVASEGAAITTPSAPATRNFAGNIGKMAEQEARDAFDSAENALWNEWRNTLGGNATGTLTKSSQTVQDILQGGLRTTNPKTGQTEIIGSTVQDAGARKFLSDIQEAAGTPQDIETLRRYRSVIGRSLDDEQAFPGMGNANKKRLYAALGEDIDDSIAKLGNPKIKEALQKANAFTKENRPLFGWGVANKAGREITEGGTTGESLLKSVLGDVDRYNTFQKALGARWDTFKTAARDALLTESQALEPGASFSVGEALNKLKLAPEIQADLFPQLGRLRQLAEQEIRISGLLKGVPKNTVESLDWMHANLDELREFLGPGGESKFRDAVRLRAAETQRLNNSILRDVANDSGNAIRKNPKGFLDSILSGTIYTNPGEVQHALQVVGRHSPKTLQDVQEQFLSRLLKSSEVEGIISGEEIAKRLAAPVGGKSPTLAGERFGIANEVLGKSKTDSLRTIASALGETQKNLLGRELNHRASIAEMLMSSDSPLDVATLLASGPLNNRSRGLMWSMFINTPARLKYGIAAKLMNDPQLLPLMAKPVSELSGAEASALITGAGLQLKD